MCQHSARSCEDYQAKRDTVTVLAELSSQAGGGACHFRLQVVYVVTGASSLSGSSAFQYEPTVTAQGL